MVRGEYNLTTAGFRNSQQHGITPLEIFEVLDSGARLFKRVGDQSMVVAGPTEAGRHLLILVTEADLEPDVWDIVAAREMTQPEINSYLKVREAGP